MPFQAYGSDQLLSFLTKRCGWLAVESFKRDDYLEQQDWFVTGAAPNRVEFREAIDYLEETYSEEVRFHRESQLRPLIWAKDFVSRDKSWSTLVGDILELQDFTISRCLVFSGS